MVAEKAYDEALGIFLMPVISERQVALIEFVRKFVTTKRQYPTQREIAVVLGISQTAACQSIDVLIKKGYLARDEKASRRNIKLTKLAMEKMAAGEEEQLELGL